MSQSIERLGALGARSELGLTNNISVPQLLPVVVWRGWGKASRPYYSSFSLGESLLLLLENCIPTQHHQHSSIRPRLWQCQHTQIRSLGDGFPGLPLFHMNSCFTHILVATGNSPVPPSGAEMFILGPTTGYPGMEENAA
ncbi:MAG TPA: hypothetical protein IGS52_11165 [Oscillatoriaceae cyanobacterium M33_DOE_052]|uniref:Uncharacterized protein n=1 Tax=Planktothricoides sp. SpSt-374 TaxID=2282167 RepID=A0A7C3VJY7_9CYAN|nr:hypothetical protein [Oscillatoriaceae cyanobacterium M33_DOE_052]